MEVFIKGVKVSLIKDDITRQKVDAIVNSANSSLLGGGGVDGAIHSAAGIKVIEECRHLRQTFGGCNVGEAVITTGGNLQAKYIIHTVGPVYRGGVQNEAHCLKCAYLSSLILGKQKNIKSIAFPSVGTGLNEYPVDEAAEIALRTIINFCDNYNGYEEIRMVLFSRNDFLVYQNTLDNIIFNLNKVS